MMTLKRSECAILSLVLTRKWYALIFSGGKTQEYRTYNKYWRVRFANWCNAARQGKVPVVEFRRGYSTYAPRMAFLAPSYGAVDYRTHPEWGEPHGPHFVIALAHRIELTKESEAKNGHA